MRLRSYGEQITTCLQCLIFSLMLSSVVIYLCIYMDGMGLPSGDPVIKSLPANAGDVETLVQSLGWEDRLE